MSLIHCIPTVWDELLTNYRWHVHESSTGWSSAQLKIWKNSLCPRSLSTRECTQRMPKIISLTHFFSIKIMWNKSKLNGIIHKEKIDSVCLDRFFLLDIFSLISFLLSNEIILGCQSSPNQMNNHLIFNFPTNEFLQNILKTLTSMISNTCKSIDFR